MPKDRPLLVFTHRPLFSLAQPWDWFTQDGDRALAILDGHPGTSACAATSVYPPLADAPLGVGESYLTADKSIRVTVTGRTAAGGWTVKVTEGTPGPDGPRLRA